jgi:DNA-binding MarR family transcriptional regulator
MSSTATTQDKASSRQKRGIALLLEQSARLVYDQRDLHSLHQVQWSALRYFARAGGKTNNVAGLAKYLGVTTAPASRTAASLVKRGLTVSSPSPEDSRSRHFTVTHAGRALLEEDPLNRVSDILGHLSQEELTALAFALDKIYSGLTQPE